MSADESQILQMLDAAVGCESITRRIDAMIPGIVRRLRENPHDLLAWEVVPLDWYTLPLPDGIRSSWVFLLRARVDTGAERHPNSQQRMMSYRGSGDFQTRTTGDWVSHPLSSERDAPLLTRWISIPPNVWHRGIVAAEDWVVVSFHTAEEQDLIEERPAADGSDALRQEKYAGRR
jgi:hypothetical protein